VFAPRLRALILVPRVLKGFELASKNRSSLLIRDSMSWIWVSRFPRASLRPPRPRLWAGSLLRGFVVKQVLGSGSRGAHGVQVLGVPVSHTFPCLSRLAVDIILHLLSFRRVVFARRPECSLRLLTTGLRSPAKLFTASVDYGVQSCGDSFEKYPKVMRIDRSPFDVKHRRLHRFRGVKVPSPDNVCIQTCNQRKA